MYRGYHKLDANVFDAMASLPSTYPTHSDPGILSLLDQNDQPLFALVYDDLMSDDFCSRIVHLADQEQYTAALLNTGDNKQEVGVVSPEVRQSQRCILNSNVLADEIWGKIQPLLPPASQVPGKRYQSKDGSKDWIAVGVNPCLRILKYDIGDRFEVHQDGAYTIEKSGTSPTRRSFLTLQIYLNDGGGVNFTGGGTRFITLENEKDQMQIKSKICKQDSKRAKLEERIQGCDVGADNMFGASTVPCNKANIGTNEIATSSIAKLGIASNDVTSLEETSNSQPSLPIFHVTDVVPRKGRILLFQHNIWHEGERVYSGTKVVLRTEIMFEQRPLSKSS